MLCGRQRETSQYLLSTYSGDTAVNKTEQVTALMGKTINKKVNVQYELVRGSGRKVKQRKQCKAGMGPGRRHGGSSGALLYIVSRKELIKAAFEHSSQRGSKRRWRQKSPLGLFIVWDTNYSVQPQREILYYYS